MHKEIRLLNVHTKRMLMLGSVFFYFACFAGDCGGGNGSAGPTPAYRGFAYITNGTDNTVSGYKVDGSTGALSAIGTWKTGNGPGAIVAVNGNNGGSVYVTNHDDNTISQYRFDENGALTPLSPPTVSTGAYPVAIASINRSIVPDILVVNQTDSSITDYTINPDGTLVSSSTFPSGGTLPVKIVVDNTSLHAPFYIYNLGSNTLCQFSDVFAVTSSYALPSSVAGSDLAMDEVVDLYVADGKSNTIAIESTRNVGGGIQANQSAAVANTPVSIAIDTNIGAPGSEQDGIYIGSSAGSIYQYQKPSENVLSAITPQTAASITFAAQQVVLRAPNLSAIPAIQHRLYSLLSNSNTVRVYSTDNLAINPQIISETPTGRYPTDIAFGLVGITTGTVQTNVKSAARNR